jgi:hypothetical protein
MTFVLSEGERELLLGILHDRLGTLREQIYHSTTSTFSDQLKEMESTLKALIVRLDAATDVPKPDA